MNLAELKRKLEETVNRQRDGESFELLWLRQRECASNRPIFWRILIRTLSKFLVKAFSVSLAATETLALALAFSLREQICWETSLEGPTDMEPLRYEYDRGSPEVFIPVPDIETGGCARNDSLVAPAI
jgi:hypothetical protein